MRDTDEHDRLFPDAGDRDLVDQDEAAALCGCSVQEFLTGVQVGMFPQWNGFPDTSKQWVKTFPHGPKGPPRWVCRPRWRRGEVVRALEEVHRRAAAIAGRRPEPSPVRVSVITVAGQRLLPPAAD